MILSFSGFSDLFHAVLLIIIFQTALYFLAILIDLVQSEIASEQIYLSIYLPTYCIKHGDWRDIHCKHYLFSFFFCISSDLWFSLMHCNRLVSN